MNTLRSFFKMVGVMILGVACGAGLIFTYHVVAKYDVAQTLFGWIPGVISPAPGTAVATDVGAPRELIIPRIGVDAPIDPVGVNASGSMFGPSDAVSVGWYDRGPRPGMAGAAVIDGHVETKYVPQGVFYHLSDVKVGDAIDVRTAAGQVFVFTVTGAKVYAYNAPTDAIFKAPAGKAELNLITCAGDWMPDLKLYNERLVVTAVLKS